MAIFSALPPEIHDTIAKTCRNNDLINLSCTSKWVKEFCLRVLYRHVDLRPDHNGLVLTADERKWQDRFFQTLLTRPEYGMHVRFLRALFHIPRSGDSIEPMVSYKEMWRAMQSLTHVRTVDIGSRNDMAYPTTALTRQFSNDLFRSATSVTLVGRMPYRLAKSILDAVNPAILKYLCLDMVQEWDYGSIPHLDRRRTHIPGDKDEGGRMIAYRPTSGLLVTLTGCCTAIRTLILRRVGQTSVRSDWDTFAETLSHLEWAAFICSVQGTLEKFTFELAGKMPGGSLVDISSTSDASPFRIADQRFRRFILPAIMAGKWPCLNTMELKGVHSPDGQAGTAALITELKTLLGGNTKIVVEEKSHYAEDGYVPDQVLV